MNFTNFKLIKVGFRMSKFKESDIIYDKIWEELYDLNNTSTMNIIDNTNSLCNNCGSDNILEENMVCAECGLILDQLQFSNYTFEIQQESKMHNKFNKLNKMQEWMSWTNSEKMEYKLKKYTRELCEQIGIYDKIIETVCDLVYKIMMSIKNNCDGPKRSRVKDGIIINCIEYVSKEIGDIKYNYADLAKKINLDMKYISKADKILTNLNLPEFNKNKQENPIEYIKNIIHKYNLEIDNVSIDKTEILINICEDNDLLLDHAPISMAIACFYYILSKQNHAIDIKKFSEIFNLSLVTLTKTINKLKFYEIKIDKLLV